MIRRTSIRLAATFAAALFWALPAYAQHTPTDNHGASDTANAVTDHAEDVAGGHGNGHGDGHGAAANPMASGDKANAIATLITFGLLLIILGKFVWPKVLKALQDREEFIRDSLTTAKQQRDEAEKLFADYKKQLENSRNEATAIVEEGRRDAEEVRRTLLDDARQEAEATMQRAKREIEIARDTAVKDLYNMTGDLATDLAGRILQKELDAASHRRLIQESIEQIGKLDSRN